jgi:hypothetical protein
MPSSARKLRRAPAHNPSSPRHCASVLAEPVWHGRQPRRRALCVSRVCARATARMCARASNGGCARDTPPSALLRCSACGREPPTHRCAPSRHSGDNSLSPNDLCHQSNAASTRKARRAAVRCASRPGKTTLGAVAQCRPARRRGRTGVLDPPPPHLHRDWAHPRHICSGTGCRCGRTDPGADVVRAAARYPSSSLTRMSAFCGGT